MGTAVRATEGDGVGLAGMYVAPPQAALTKANVRTVASHLTDVLNAARGRP
ncbi:MAG TPA: hypothetical protein VGA16_05815 [Candidatus Limnocylindria bacterium]